MEEKEIVISNLSQKTITPKPGATWKAFNVYQILGNDGKTYETTDLNFYQSLKLGQQIKIKYTVDTKNVSGKIYTSYKIFNEKAGGNLGGIVRILERLDKMEKNVLEQVKEMIDPKPKLVHEADDYLDVPTSEDIGF